MSPICAGLSTHWLALAGSVVLSACAQVLLKKGAVSDRRFMASLNPTTLTGYALFGCVTVLSVYAFQQVELKTGTAWISATYLLVAGLAHLFLGEPLTRSKIVGCSLVVAGGITFAVA